MTAVPGRDAVVGRLQRLFSAYENAPAIQFEGRWFTWGDVGRVTRVLEAAAADHAVPTSAPIVAVMRDRPGALAGELAALATGRTAILVSALVGDRALADDVAALRAPVVIAHSSDWQRQGFGHAVAAAGSVGVVTDDDLAASVCLRPAALPEAASIDAAVTVQTSGTTGPPKRLPVAWSTFVEVGGTAREPGTASGTLILSLPLVTLGGMRSVAKLVFGGRPLAMMERFDARRWVALVKEHRPRVIGAPPPVVKMVLDADISPDHFEGVEAYTTSSAPVDPAIAEAFERRYGIPVLVGYGATEFLDAVTGWTPALWEEFGARKRGSVGRARPGVRLRVVDPASVDGGGPVDVPVGDEGLLEVDPPRRAGNLPGGWLRTADRARLDADGFLWILGRADDVIIRGGFKVDLTEVERQIRTHPDVLDAAVIGLPDDRVGAIPAAAVVPRPGRSVTPDDVVAWVRRRLPPYASPALVRVVAHIPQTATSKTHRAGLQELLSED